MSETSGGDFGAGSMQEAGRKMHAHVDEAEARRPSSQSSGEEPPRTDRTKQLLLACLMLAAVVAGAVFLFTRSEAMSPLEVCRANGDHYAGGNTCCKPGSPLLDRDCYQAGE